MVKHGIVRTGIACFVTLFLGVAVLAADDMAKGTLTLAEDGRTS